MKVKVLAGAHRRSGPTDYGPALADYLVLGEIASGDLVPDGEIDVEEDRPTVDEEPLPGDERPAGDEAVVVGVEPEQSRVCRSAFSRHPA